MAGFVVVDYGSNSKTWSSANWVYYGVLDRAIENSLDYPEAVRILTQSRHLQSLNVLAESSKGCGASRRIFDSLALSCQQILEGKFAAIVNGKKLDADSQVQFRNAVSDLFELLTEARRIDTNMT